MHTHTHTLPNWKTKTIEIPWATEYLSSSWITNAYYLFSLHSSLNTNTQYSIRFRITLFTTRTMAVFDLNFHFKSGFSSSVLMYRDIVLKYDVRVRFNFVFGLFSPSSTVPCLCVQFWIIQWSVCLWWVNAFGYLIIFHTSYTECRVCPCLWPRLLKLKEAFIVQP